MATSFILQFQEPTFQRIECTREVALGTMTKTFTREETDQDPGFGSLGTLHGTQTHSRTREEPDQDPAVGTSPHCGTMTFTKAREEPDQDPAMSLFRAIPVQ